MSLVWTRKIDASASFYLHLILNVYCSVSSAVFFRYRWFYKFSWMCWMICHFQRNRIGIGAEAYFTTNESTNSFKYQLQLQCCECFNSFNCFSLHWSINFGMWSVCNYIPKNPRLLMHLNRFSEFAVNVLSECCSFHLNGA